MSRRVPPCAKQLRTLRTRTPSKMHSAAGLVGGSRIVFNASTHHELQANAFCDGDLAVQRRRSADC